MDSEELLKFIQSVGITDYSKAREISSLGDRNKLIQKLLENSSVRKNYDKSYKLEEALKQAGLYYKF
jgi:hypothetical protein